jgi:hypothetical protein
MTRRIKKLLAPGGSLPVNLFDNLRKRPTSPDPSKARRRSLRRRWAALMVALIARWQAW